MLEDGHLKRKKDESIVLTLKELTVWYQIKVNRHLQYSEINARKGKV